MSFAEPNAFQQASSMQDRSLHYPSNKIYSDRLKDALSDEKDHKLEVNVEVKLRNLEIYLKRIKSYTNRDINNEKLIAEIKKADLCCQTVEKMKKELTGDNSQREVDYSILCAQVYLVNVCDYFKIKLNTPLDNKNKAALELELSKLDQQREEDAIRLKKNAKK